MKRQRPSESRSRVLNVLYFVDANKTKSFKMSLRALYTLVATLGILLVWSFVSTLLLYQEAQVANYRQDRITHLLSTIFSYQQRYDAIYERSYPSAPKTVAGTLDKISKEAEAFGTASPIAKTIAAAKAGSNPSSAKPAAKDQGTKKAEKTTTPIAANATAQPKEKPNAGAAEQPAPPPPFAAVLEAISGVARDQQKVDVAFSIRNNTRPKRAIGYVFARATFEQNGKEVVKTAPAGPNFDRVDRPIRARGYKFSIRSFTRKNITLTYPPGGGAKLTKLELLMWSNKKMEKTYPVALSRVKIKKPLPPPAPAKPAQAGPEEPVASPSAPQTNPLPSAEPSPAAGQGFAEDDTFPRPKLKGVTDDGGKTSKAATRANSRTSTRAAPAKAVAEDQQDPREIAKDIPKEQEVEEDGNF